MKFARKKIWTTIGIAAALIGVLALALVWVLQSAWFRDQVRRRIVAQVEKATAGRVEIAGFDYDWRKLTADLQGFVIHGTEPPGATPLLRVETVRVKVRIISALERSADVSSIVLSRPEVNLIVAPDGSTNIPPPRLARKNDKTPIQQLFALKLNHCEIRDGLLVASDKRVPLNFRGDGVDMAVDYRRAGPSYEMKLSARQIDFGLRGIQRGPLSLSAQARLERDRVILQSAELTGADSRISGSGTLESFVHPRADFQLEASAPVNDVMPLIRLSGVRGGKVAVRGVGRYDETNGWSFSGKANAEQTGYYSHAFTLKSIDAGADVEASRLGLTLRHLTAASLGAKLVGEATLKKYRNLSLEGNISGLTLREVGSFFTNKPLAWQGTSSGRVRVVGAFEAKPKDFAMQADLTISRESAGIPVSGDVQLNYLQESNSVDFGQSHLNFPHSNISFAGSLRGQTQVVVDSGNLEDLRPVLDLTGLRAPPDAWPVLLSNGRAHFDGSIGNVLSSPIFEGQLEASEVRLLGQTIDDVKTRFSVSANGIDFASLSARQGDTRVSGTGLLGFDNWLVNADSPVRVAAALRGVNVSKIAAQFSVELPIIQGIASGSLELRGTVGHPQGRAHIASDSLDAYGERLNQVQFDADAAGERLRITNGRVVSGAAVLSFSGDYRHLPDTWKNGLARVKVDSNGFPLGSLSPLRKYEPALNAEAEVHFEASAQVSPGKFEPAGADGTIDLRKITLNRVPYGNLTLRGTTRGQHLDAAITGDLRNNALHGTATVDLTGDNRTTAEVDLDRVTVASIYDLTGIESPALFDGSLTAKVRLDGALQKPEQIRATLTADQLQLSSKLNSDETGKTNEPVVSLHNAGPLVLEAANGIVTVHSFRIEGDNTGLVLGGTVAYQDNKAMDLKVTGAVNLQVFHLFDPNVNSSGVSVISAAIGGTLRDPSVNGTLAINDGSFFLQNIPNGLSAVNGTVTFNRDRATLQKMTARSGGGDLTLGGFVSFGGGNPLVYHLDGAAENVRVRYAGSISVTASSKLRLSGTSSSSLLSGTLTVSRVAFNPNTDVGNLLASLGATGATSTNENDFLTGLHFEVIIESAPNMQLSTSLSRDVEAEINLRLRGTPDHPILLGNLAANQGDIRAFGARYTINRGEISFVNPVKIEPALDLDLETRARGVTVDITISGTFSKLNIAYRSDPPLQPREIIALLAVGRAPDSTNSAANLRTNDVNALQSGANSLLGAAVTSPVTNRLSKIFGITNIKIDPLVEGITNTPQARVTLEQQVSPDITITYITNLSQTSEQIFRLEWALSRKFSVVALRDDNGEFGIDFQYKRTFK